MEDCTTPSWLNKVFIREVLQSMEKEPQEIEVLKWTCKPAVPTGNNYLSQLYRVETDYKTQNGVQTVSVLIKTPLDSGIIREFTDTIQAYSRELRMYQKVLPKMYKLLEHRLAPKSFTCPLKDALALEDLRTQGFKMADRLKQLDVDQCQQFFITLARLHALSVALHHKQPDLIEDVGKQVFFTQQVEMEEEFWKMNLRSTAITARKLKGCERFADKLMSKVDNFYETMERLYKPAGGLNVLNHGDCWTNNILFKYNELGKVIDVKLIDFQLPRYSSFAHDIHIFWTTSANEDVREHHKEEMFEVYRTTLNQTLEDLNCRERLTKDEFQKEIKLYAPIALQNISHILSLIMADPNDLVNFDDFTLDQMTTTIPEDSAHLRTYESKYFKAVLPSILQQAELFGAFGE